ncbi:hypothetical protein D3C84_698800 [compost metagenome]
MLVAHGGAGELDRMAQVQSHVLARELMHRPGTQAMQEDRLMLFEHLHTAVPTVTVDADQQLERDTGEAGELHIIA